MHFKESKLKFVYHYTLRTDYKFVINDTKSNKQIPPSIINKYELLIDFNIRFDEKEFFANIHIVISINYNKKPLDGYSILVETSSGFDLKKMKKAKQEEINYVLHYSALPLAINYARNYIGQITKDFPIGSYTVPLIDLRTLISDKMELLKIETETEKISTNDS